MPYKDPEKRREYYKKYHISNRDKLLEYQRKYRLNNKKKIRLGYRKHWLANRDKINESHRKYYSNNKAKVSEMGRKYRLNNPDKRRENGRRWDKANPDKVLMKGRKRRARKNNIVHTFTQEEWRAKLIHTFGVCPNCNKYVSLKKLTLDHIYPLSKAHIGRVYMIKDIQPLCMPCNSSKGNKII